MKEQYLKFCEVTEGLTIFMQPWFLDIVCGSNNWDICMDISKNGKVNGVLVFHFVQKWGFKILKMPTLTPYMNLWIRNETTWKTEYKLSFEKSVLQNIFSQLPTSVFSLQMYPPSLQNWLPLWWAGYRVEPMMNYVLDDLKDIDCVWLDMKSTIRNTINKAKKLNVKITTCEDIDLFYSIFKQTVERIGFKTGITQRILSELHQEIQNRNAGKIFLAIDADGNICATFYIIWNEITAFYWIAAMNENFNKNGATSLLLWEVLQKMNQQGIQKFVAIGSMAKNLEFFITRFGFKQEVYWKITRYGNRFFEFLHFLKKTIL